MRARILHHKRMKGSSLHLYNAMLKYDVVMTILANNLDEEEACLVEEMLRPEKVIGWNLVKGGGLPPPNGYGNKNSMYKGAVIGFNKTTKETIRLCGQADIRRNGFEDQNISRSIKKGWEHKGYTWSREVS